MAAPISSGVNEIKVYGMITETPAVEKRVVNVFHYAQATPQPTLPDNSAIINVFYSTVWQPLLALLHLDYQMIEIGSRWIDVTTNPEILSQISGAGGKSGTRLPAYVSVCVQLKTLLRGRSYKGSKHLSPIDEASTDKDVLTPAAITSWKAVAFAMTQPLPVSNQSMIPCVLSRKNSQLAVDPTTIVASGISTYLLNASVGTLRKRREKTEIA